MCVHVTLAFQGLALFFLLHTHAASFNSVHVEREAHLHSPIKNCLRKNKKYKQNWTEICIHKFEWQRTESSIQSATSAVSAGNTN